MSTSAGHPAKSKIRCDNRNKSGPLRLVDSFCDQARVFKSPDQLKALLEDVTRELGFRYFALVHHDRIWHEANDLIRIDNYPRSWEDEYRINLRDADDPVHQACYRHNTGFDWRDLGRIIRLDGLHHAVLDQGRRFGISDGFTVPANIPGEPKGSCTFAGRVRQGPTTELLLCAELIGAYAFQAARRINGPITEKRPHLSRRERECLRLVAAGKSNWEIAAILGLSSHTVHQYVKRARAAYDVVSRCQLVALGLRDSLIDYRDANRDRG